MFLAGLGMVKTDQQRRHPRVKAPKGLLIAWEAGTRRAVSYLESIALGGFFIRTKQPPPVRSALRVLVELPSGDIRARAVVRRVAPAKGMGIELTAMNPEDRARLNQLLKPLLAEAGW
jgi:hypothetical protein